MSLRTLVASSRELLQTKNRLANTRAQLPRAGSTSVIRQGAGEIDPNVHYQLSNLQSSPRSTGGP